MSRGCKSDVECDVDVIAFRQRVLKNKRGNKKPWVKLTKKIKLKWRHKYCYEVQR